MFSAYVQCQILLSFTFWETFLIWLVWLSFLALLSVAGVRFFCREVLLNTSFSHLLSLLAWRWPVEPKLHFLLFMGIFGNLATGDNDQKPAHVRSWGRDMRGMDRMSLNEKPSFWYRRLVKLQPFSFWAEELKCHMGWAQLCHCLKSIVRWDLSMSEWLTSKLDPKFLKAPNKMSTYSFSKNSWSLLSFQGVSFLCRGCYK